MKSSAKSIAVEVCAEVGKCMSRVDEAELDGAVEFIARAERVFVAGAGRSGYAVRALAMRLMHMGKRVFVVGETTTPAIAKSDLLIIGSGSGRTASLVAAAEKARGIGAAIMLVTIDVESSIARLADCVVRVDAASPKATGGASENVSIQPMGAMFEQVMFLLFDSLVVALMRAENMSSDAMFKNHANLE